MKTMKPFTHRGVRVLVGTFGIGWLGDAGLRAQAAPAPATSPGQTTAVAAAAKEQAVTLSVFEVKADPTDTYDATNTNSVTGTNTPLNKTPLDAKIFNRQMLAAREQHDRLRPRGHGQQLRRSRDRRHRHQVGDEPVDDRHPVLDRRPRLPRRRRVQ
ncbi:MAG: hypothetical protein HY736_14510 [Verrucomicrobia bacterium]|nr:hypothetical protein [Verrucomicrobiota bacterium]